MTEMGFSVHDATNAERASQKIADLQADLQAALNLLARHVVSIRARSDAGYWVMNEEGTGSVKTLAEADAYALEYAAKLVKAQRI